MSQQINGGSFALYGINKMALAPDGSVWVINNGFRKIQHYSADGALLSEFGSPSTGAGQFSFPWDIQIAADGSVWLIDSASYRVLHYRVDGVFITAFGDGIGAGQLAAPRHIALAKDGSVWVSDGISFSGYGLITQNYHLQHFKADGTFIEEFGSLSVDPSINIVDIAVVADGTLWVADRTYFNHFKADGSLIETINSLGLGGQSTSATNVELAVDSSLWAVSDGQYFRHRSVDGSSLIELRSDLDCIAKYDDINQTVYLYDVLVGQQLGIGQQYNAILQYHNGQYDLLSAVLSTHNKCSQPYTGGKNAGYFTLNDNILIIPAVTLVDYYTYTATFKYLGNSMFNLQSLNRQGN